MISTSNFYQIQTHTRKKSLKSQNSTSQTHRITKFSWKKIRVPKTKEPLKFQHSQKKNGIDHEIKHKQKLMDFREQT